MSYTDTELIQMLREGDAPSRKAIEFLYNTYFNYTRAIVLKTFGSDDPFVTKDLHGVTIMALVQRLQKMDFTLEQSIKQYFIGILKYKKIDLLNKQIEERKRNQLITEGGTDSEDTLENEYWAIDKSVQSANEYDLKKSLFLTCFYQAFEGIRNENHKFILCKRLYEGLDYADITRQNRDETTMRQDYHRGLMGILNAVKTALGVDYTEDNLKTIKSLLLEKDATRFMSNLKNICSQYV